METNDSPDIPAFATLAADPEIAPLLAFDPAPRKVDRPDGWTPELQRELIARIAATGSPGKAVDQMDKNLSGAKHLYRSDGADSFRDAWKAAIELAAERKRQARAALPPRPAEVPGTQRPRKPPPAEPDRTGQVENELGDWEDEDAFQARAVRARDSISEKLIRARRLYLAEISTNSGKRAAFEILTDLPIDWDKAERLEEQPDEPFRNPNMLKPDMLLTAENGWMGDYVHGPDKVAELRRAVDAYREENGWRLWAGSREVIPPSSSWTRSGTLLLPLFPSPLVLSLSKGVSAARPKAPPP